MKKEVEAVFFDHSEIDNLNMSFQVTRVQINNQVLDRIITMGSCQRGCVMVNRWLQRHGQTWDIIAGYIMGMQKLQEILR